MHLHVLQAENFRNLRQVLIEPHPRFNVFHGDNGQGKTNLLEAIYFLATLRSFRMVHSLEELIRFEERTCAVRSRVERQQVERLLTVQLCAGKPLRKMAQLDGKPSRGGDYFGGCAVVLFSPDDLRLPKGSPGQRRRFLDRAVWNTCPAYLKEVQSYERILKNRNALLRGDQPHSLAARPGTLEDLLEVYDEQLAEAGAVMGRFRRDYLHQLEGRLISAFDRVSGAGPRAGVRYLSPVADQNELREQLKQDRRRDLHRGYTHSGPHTDDLLFELGGRSAALYASQGQLRALVLALKIAEIQHLGDVLGDSPVLLLDDVSSELDPTKNAQLFEILLEVPCQTFITTTSPAHILLSDERRDFHVCAGTIEKDDSAP